MDMNISQVSLMTGGADAPDWTPKKVADADKNSGVPDKDSDVKNLVKDIFDPQDNPQKVNATQAHAVAKKLKIAIPSHTIRFVVRDPAHVGTDVVIEVLNDKDQVVATIPPKGILGMSAAPNEDAFKHEVKGVLLDQKYV